MATRTLSGIVGQRRGMLVLVLFLLVGCTTTPAEESATGGTAYSGHVLFMGEAADGSHTLYRAAPDGRDLEELPTSGLLPVPPAVSPDGRHIAYASACGGSFDTVMTMHSDGAQPRSVLDQPNVSAVHDLAWAPGATATDEERLAFVADRQGETTLMLIGLYPTALYPMPAAPGAAAPSWAPDGERVAFVAEEPGEPDAANAGSHNLYVVEVVSRTITRLTDGALQASAPRWSPDGERIVFVGQAADQGSTDLYTIRSDGSALAALTDTPEAEQSPAWSPDGTQLAFSLSASDDASAIYVMNADGSAQTRLANTTGVARSLSWSPDGQAIAFVAGQAEQQWFVSIVPATGGEPMQVREHPLAVPWVAWAAEPAAETATETRVITGVIAEFDAMENEITLEQPANGYTRVMLDEDPPGMLNTQVTSADGLLGLTPTDLTPGQPIMVRGHAADGDTLSADVVWLMNVEGQCRSAASPYPFTA